MKRRLERLVF